MVEPTAIHLAIGTRECERRKTVQECDGLGVELLAGEEKGFGEEASAVGNIGALSALDCGREAYVGIDVIADLAR